MWRWFARKKDMGRMDCVEPAAVILLDDDDFTYTACYSSFSLVY